MTRQWCPETELIAKFFARCLCTKDADLIFLIDETVKPFELCSEHLIPFINEIGRYPNIKNVP